METQKRNNKRAKGVSAKLRVERLIPPTARDQFASVLKAEQLEDIPPGFRDPTFFDEVPLYSRYEQVDFLKHHGEVDRLLLELSLDYLKRVRSELPATTSKRFLALTIVRDDDNECIVPCIFVCNSNAKRRMKDLRLSVPSKGLGKHVQSLMRKTEHSQDYSVLEDRSTFPDEVRVFVSYKTPPQGLIGLEAFTNGASV